MDRYLDSLISGQLGPGWVGGDATYSTRLPGGREAFDFSDTLVGTAQQNGTATLTGMVHNSELAGSMPNLTSDIAGTYSSPQTLIPDEFGDGDQWEVAATYVENNKQLIFANEFAPGNPYNRFTGRSGIAVLTVPSQGNPSYSSNTAVPTDPATQWGRAVTHDAAFTYIYGTDIDPSTFKFSGMKIARVPRGESLNTNAWQYWNGALWVGGEANATPMPTSNLFSGVAPQQNGSGYVAVLIAGGGPTATTVDVTFACAPEGPWSAPIPVYTVPQITQYQGEIAYFPTFHPELSGKQGLVVSYDVNTLDGLVALEQNVHEYQPRFLLLG